MNVRKDKVRLIVADDSQLARDIIIELLATDPAIEIVATAVNGAQAVEMATDLRPDLITMDIEMPVMNGLEAIEAIMRKCPVPILVVTSRADARLAYEAVSRGALEVIEKPVFGDACFANFSHKIKLLAGVRVIRHISRETPMLECTKKASNILQAASGRKIVAIAASLGGPKILERILSRIPADFPAPIVVAQHISAGFATDFAAWLNQKTSLDVRLASAQAKLKAGEVLIAPPEYNMRLTSHDNIELLPALAQQRYHPSCNELLFSVAQVYGRAAVGIILTGMGDDGVQGLQKIKAAGGLTIAQDQQSCTVDSMPGRAIEKGAVDWILQVDEISERIVWVMKQ